MLVVLIGVLLSATQVFFDGFVQQSHIDNCSFYSPMRDPMHILLTPATNYLAKHASLRQSLILTSSLAMDLLFLCALFRANSSNRRLTLLFLQLTMFYSIRYLLLH